MVEAKYKVEGIQFIINSTTVSDRYRVSTDTQSPGIGIGIGTEKVGSVHSYLCPGNTQSRRKSLFIILPPSVLSVLFFSTFWTVGWTK